MAQDRKLTDADRRKWINNDEGLYRWWRSQRTPMQKFIRDHRNEIDAVISNVLSGTRRAHYLAYDRV